jgi:hypothetical protein
MAVSDQQETSMNANNPEPDKADSRFSLQLDASQWDAGQWQAAIHRLADDSRVRVVGLSNKLSGIGAGLDRAIDVQVEGDVGPFAFMLSKLARIEISLGAGLSCAHSFQSGTILIRGDCGPYLAAYAVGGLVAVHGRAADFAAYGLCGGEVVIRSRCGAGAGAGMKSGTLIIGNGAGEKLGQGMSGGTIFVRGTVDSLGEGVQPIPVREADSLRLGLLLARAGLKTKLAEFQAFRSKSFAPM